MPGTAGGGGHAGAIGQAGAGGQAGSPDICRACVGVAADCTHSSSPREMCESEGRTCCDANAVGWLCQCAAETCYWYIRGCDPTGTGGSGGSAGGGGSAGNSGADGGVQSDKCLPHCGPGSVCVGSGTEGGAVILADAGVCPLGTHLLGNGMACERDLVYVCQPIPTACGGTARCACGASYFCHNFTCYDPTAGEIDCIQQVP
jgi:hypothetical protein